MAAFGLCAAPADEPPEKPSADGADGEDGTGDDSPAAGQSAGPRIYLWPCNLPTFNAWQRLQTQWAHDASGKPTGLPNDRVIPFLERVLRLKPKPFAEMFDGLQAMERAALDVWREQRSE
jgi:Phage related hypothetical protein (DUF1799)